MEGKTGTLLSGEERCPRVSKGTAQGSVHWDLTAFSSLSFRTGGHTGRVASPFLVSCAKSVVDFSRLMEWNGRLKGGLSLADIYNDGASHGKCQHLHALVGPPLEINSVNATEGGGQRILRAGTRDASDGFLCRFSQESLRLSDVGVF